jgi:hypothetical protein
MENNDLPDYNLCILCQNVTNEKLTNPAANEEVRGYNTLASNLALFHELGVVPFSLKLSLIARIDNLEAIFKENRAVWHKSCYLKCNKTKLQRAQQRTNKISDDAGHSARITRSKMQTCLFCDRHDTKRYPLNSVATASCSQSILETAANIEDSKILGMVSEARDLIGAKYHVKCLTTYKRKKKWFKILSNLKQEAKANSLAQIISYINEVKATSDQTPTFNVVELAKMQSTAMASLGVEYKVNPARLRERLLEQCPYLTCTIMKGKPALLMFKEDVDCALRSVKKAQTFDNDDVTLCNAAKITRSHIFGEDNTSSSGKLIALLNMIINGSSATTNQNILDICHHLAELIIYHMLRKPKKARPSRKHRNIETLTPVYVAAKLYAATRKKKLIDITCQRFKVCDVSVTLTGP